jgi:homeobox protein cut-like
LLFLAGGGSSTPSTPAVSAASLFPPGLQTVETFGSFLGEEIVANWRRSLERTILSQNASSLPSASQPQQDEEDESPKNEADRPSAPCTPEVENKSTARASCSPPPTASTPSMQQMLQQHQAALHQHMFLNGASAPKTPPADSPSSGMNSPNGPVGHLSGPVGPPTSSSTPLLASDQHPKSSPFRFDERGPFRFEDRLSLGESLIPKGDPMEARLQEMLRYNMDQYASQNLDTLHIARRVRELLSIHNIGQRLFAKYVLGLSQGTVSELLSKPKPWDKLTEKGRDSYRKMHAWACDEHAVMLLKSLIPKKGK